MNALEARELSLKNLKGPVIEPYLEAIHKRIKEAAEKGETHIINPLAGLRLYAQPDAIKVIWQALSSEGYNVNHRPDPDPGSPISTGPYTEISW